MSSWCCKNCPPFPRPPISVDSNFPIVCAPYYAVCAKESTDEPSPTWWAPVFLSDPGSGVTASQKTLYIGGDEHIPINVYTLPTSKRNSRPTNFPILTSRPCTMRVCTSSQEQTQSMKDDNIRINVQNGTWCKSPMSSSEYLEYSKAMDGIKNVYTSAGCC